LNSKAYFCYKYQFGIDSFKKRRSSYLPITTDSGRRPFMRIQVDCYAGYRGEETPRRIRMATYDIEVKKVLDRWLAPDHRYFKIMGDDDATYIIRHDTVKWEWELVFYRAVEVFTGNNSEFGES
jgi:hypothetical protein